MIPTNLRGFSEPYVNTRVFVGCSFVLAGNLEYVLLSIMLMVDPESMMKSAHVPSIDMLTRLSPFPILNMKT